MTSVYERLMQVTIYIEFLDCMKTFKDEQKTAYHTNSGDFLFLCTVVMHMMTRTTVIASKSTAAADPTPAPIPAMM